MHTFLWFPVIRSLTQRKVSKTKIVIYYQITTLLCDCMLVSCHVSLRSTVAWMSKNSLLETGTISEI